MISQKITQFPFVTASQMQNLDRLAMEHSKIPSLQLMENAGTQVAQWISVEYPVSCFNKISVICGAGNNGGDGFVTARKLAENGYQVHVYQLVPDQKLSPDAKVNSYRFSGEKRPLEHSRHWDFFLKDLQTSSLIIDAIFGTGLSRPIEGWTKTLIDQICCLKAPIVSIDLPSGLDADSGSIWGACILADATITLELPKWGLAFGPFAHFAGHLCVAPIGIPRTFLKKMDSKSYLIVPDLFKDHFSRRQRNTHKNSYGHVLGVAGSKQKIGAGLLMARAALRAGAGLSTLALPEVAYQAIDPKFSEIMFLVMPDDQNGFSKAAVGSLLEASAKKSVLACGPGLGTSLETSKCLLEFLKQNKLPKILDADALNILSTHPDILKKIPGPCVLTPHPAEMKRLMFGALAEEHSLTEITSDAVLSFAKKYRVWVILKGYRSFVATPSGDLFVNSSGNPGMATAGAGDVLTGILAGLVAQKIPFETALIAGLWIHGRAGDWVSDQKGERGIVAWDLAEKVPEVLRSLGSHL